MSPTLIIAIVRDVAIVGALIFIVWWIRTSGANAVKVSDMQAVQKQIAAQATQQAQWAQEARNAAIQRTQDMAQVTAAIGAQRAPILVQPATQPACPDHLPASPAASSSSTAGSGGIISGAGRDIRPAINAFELKYETALADCRAAIASWPK